MTGGALQHLTYFAGQTTRIDVGTMVIVLPWYDPVLVAEQVSVLDNLLQGRRHRRALHAPVLAVEVLPRLHELDAPLHAAMAGAAPPAA